MLELINGFNEIANDLENKSKYKMSSKIDKIITDLCVINKKINTWKKFANKNNIDKIRTNALNNILYNSLELTKVAIDNNEKEIAQDIMTNILKESQFSQGLWQGLKGIGRGIKKLLGNTYEQALGWMENIATDAPKATTPGQQQQITTNVSKLRQWLVEEAARTKDKDFYQLANNFSGLIQNWNGSMDTLPNIMQQAMTNFRRTYQQTQQQGQQDPIQAVNQRVLEVLQQGGQKADQLYNILGFGSQQ